MILLKKVVKKYSNFELNVSFDVKKAEIFGIIGSSGSGKSTILRLIQGLIKQDDGEININKGTKISYVFQEYNLLNNKTVYDNVALPLLLQGKLDDDKVKKYLSFVNLEDKADMYISSLSGGQKQRVALARALVSEPDVLLCDEITSALDNATKYEILNLLKDINEKKTTTIILITHELDVVKNICSRVGIIEDGKILDIIKVGKSLEVDNNKSYFEYAKEYLI